MRVPEFTVVFDDGFIETVPNVNIVESPGGFTIFTDSSHDEGTFYPYHRMREAYIKVVDK